MAEKHNHKVIKFHKPIHFNIGTVIFVVIFLYLMYFVVSYFTTKHTSAYEVPMGSIAQDSTFRGLILRDETVYYAQDSGYIRYYRQNNSKVGVGNYIYSIDPTGTYYQQLADQDGQLTLSQESYKQLEAVTNQYLSNYSDMNFQEVYQFKYDIETELMAALQSTADQAGLADQTQGVGLLGYTAPAAGVVVYHVDGLEGATLDTISPDMFDMASYTRENLLQRQEVSSGNPVYKLVNSEVWQLVMPITEELAEDLAEEENIQVEFQKDSAKAWGESSMIRRGDQVYLVLEFKNSMIRYASERYAQVKLVLSDTTGLKIPNSSLLSKDFYVISQDYITKGGDSDQNGLLVQGKGEDGNTTVTFTPVTIFYQETDQCYVDPAALGTGTVIVRPDSTETKLLQETASLEGVYNINRGYAVFRRVERLFSNEEYTIIRTGTSLGISMYDHIALDSSAVSENEIIH